jgi:phosphoenolpyruvate-protein kinase (PTS system EI component)
MMLEVPPPAAFAIPQFGPDADFFSAGTNDLAQYFPQPPLPTA